MLIETLTWQSGRGWSATFPQLDSERTLVLVFGKLAEAPAIDALIRAYPSSKILGCSSAGEIHDTHVNDDTLSVAVARFEKTELRLATASVQLGTSSRETGASLARALDAPGLRGIFVLSDGLAVNGTELLGGIYSVLPPRITVSGGLAGDGSRFSRTLVLASGTVQSEVVAAVGFYGDALQIQHGSRGGWDAFGPERFVTRARANVLYELDGQPALSLYKAYLGDRAQGLPATALLFPLALRGRSSEETLVRTILSVDEAAQSMTFAGDIPEGAIVQLMRANFDRLIEGASEAGRQARLPKDVPCLSVAVSCVGRRLVLGERTEEEVDAVLESLPRGAPLVGFYSYGEISPLAPGQCGALHNQTMTLTRYWEG
jgi:hypothetical protein